MHATELSEFLSKALDIKRGTVVHYAKTLREAALLTRGKQGRYAGAEMTPSDAINLTLALLLEHGRGECIASNVKRARELPVEKLTQLPPVLGDRLTCLSAATAGEAFDALIDDIRSERIGAWSAGEDLKLSVTMEARGHSVIFSLSAEQGSDLRRAAMLIFAKQGNDESRPRFMERNITINRALFVLLAAKLGAP
jgi:hypothetical protein